MNELDNLRKIVEEARQASVRPALWEPYRLYNALADGIEELLDRVAELEKRKPVQAACYQWRDQRDEAEAAIERVREQHQKDYTVLNHLYCNSCGTLYPCPTIRAVDTV